MSLAYPEYKDFFVDFPFPRRPDAHLPGYNTICNSLRSTNGTGLDECTPSTYTSSRSTRVDVVFNMPFPSPPPTIRNPYKMPPKPATDKTATETDDAQSESTQETTKTGQRTNPSTPRSDASSKLDLLLERLQRLETKHDELVQNTAHQPALTNQKIDDLAKPPARQISQNSLQIADLVKNGEKIQRAVEMILSSKLDRFFSQDETQDNQPVDEGPWTEVLPKTPTRPSNQSSKADKMDTSDDSTVFDQSPPSNNKRLTPLSDRAGKAKRQNNDGNQFAALDPTRQEPLTTNFMQPTTNTTKESRPNSKVGGPGNARPGASRGK